MASSTLSWPRLNQTQRRNITGYLFITPWLLGLLTFTLVPIAVVFVLGFTRYGVLDTPEWVGLRNYVRIFTDDRYFRINITS